MRLKKLDAEIAAANGETDTKKPAKGQNDKKAKPQEQIIIKEETIVEMKEDAFDLDVERVNQENDELSMRAPQLPLAPLPNHHHPLAAPTWGPPQYGQPTWPPPI